MTEINKQKELVLIARDKSNKETSHAALVALHEKCKDKVKYLIYTHIKNKNNSLTYDDYEQVAFFGVLKALEKYDLNKEILFTTYAYEWIRDAFKTESKRYSNFIEISYTIYESGKKNINSKLSFRGNNGGHDDFENYTSNEEDTYPEFLNFVNALARDVLTDGEYEVFKCIAGVERKPMSLKKTAQFLDKSYDMVRQHKVGITIKMERYREELYDWTYESEDASTED